MVVVPPIAFLALFVGWAIVEPTRVLAGQYVNDRVETLGRATVLSAMAMVSALTVIPFHLGSGVLSDAVSPRSQTQGGLVTQRGTQTDSHYGQFITLREVVRMWWP